MDALGQLTGGVAHDFNNLIGVTLGNAELLLTSLEEDSKGYRWAKQIQEASLRAAELTRQLLAFSRRQALAPQPLNLFEQVLELEPLLQTTLGENCPYKLSVTKETLWLANIDRNQLESALLNLVINAKDAMPEGGNLYVEAANAVLTPTPGLDLQSGEYVSLSIRDTGTGMSAETLERAFEPFFTTKSMGKGTGLGLSMVFGFVQQSGGTIEIHSAPSAGTEIILYFPRFLDNPEKVVTLAPKTRNLEERPKIKRHAMVIEDNMPLRTLIHEYLIDLGFDIAEASGEDDLAEGLESLPKVDLVISDILLRGKKRGPELAAEVVAAHPTAKVVFITGFAATTPISELGSVLQKPFSRDQFIDTVITALGEVAANA